MKKFETEVWLSREMTLMDTTLIDVGAMSGAGIFVLIGIATGVPGPALILVFTLNGLVALLTAMSYAEFAAVFVTLGGIAIVLAAIIGKKWMRTDGESTEGKK
jgi:amino acid transporter